MIMVYHGKKIGHNGSEDITQTVQGFRNHVEMANVNGRRECSVKSVIIRGGGEIPPVHTVPDFQPFLENINRGSRTDGSLELIPVFHDPLL